MPEWIRTCSYYLLLWHALGGLATLAVYYLFWAKCHPNKEFSQKKLWMETQNRLFPPTTKTHSLSPLTVGTPPLYWLGIGWWYSGPCVLASLSFVFVFFYSHVVYAIANWFCFVLLCVYSTSVYPLLKRV